MLSLTVFISSWVAGYIAMLLIFSHSTNALAYGLISGWWCALYASRIFSVRLSVSVGAFAVYFVYALLAVYLDFPSFYHDAPKKIDFAYFMSAVFTAIIFASPLVTDFIVRKVATYFIGKGDSHRNEITSS